MPRLPSRFGLRASYTSCIDRRRCSTVSQADAWRDEGAVSAWRETDEIRRESTTAGWQSHSEILFGPFRFSCEQGIPPCISQQWYSYIFICIIHYIIFNIILCINIFISLLYIICHHSSFSNMIHTRKVEMVGPKRCRSCSVLWLLMTPHRFESPCGWTRLGNTTRRSL